MRSYKTRTFGPIATLLWENWRQTYLAFFVSLLLGAGVTHSLAEMQRLYPNNAWSDPDLPSYAMCWFALFMYGAIALFSLADPKSLSARIPNRHYCLPMRTGTMVAVHLFYRVASFSLLSLALFTLMRLEFGEIVTRSLPLDVVVAVLIFSYALAVSWSWGSAGLWRMILVAIGLPLVALVYLAMMRYSHSTPFSSSFVEVMRSHGVDTSRPQPFFESAAGIAVLVVLATAYLVIAYISVLRGRSHATRGAFAASRPMGIFKGGPRIIPSSQQAQMWYEWRRKGLVLPGLTVCFTIAAVTFAWIAQGTDMEVGDFAEAFLLIPVYASFFAAFFTGLYMLSVDYRHASSGLSTFLYTRPLSTDAYTRARLRMSVQSVLVNLCLCLALGLTGLVLMGVDAHRVRPVEFTDLNHLPFIVFALVAYGLALWSLLWMSVPVLIYLVWFGCVFYYQTLANDSWDRANEHALMFWLVWIPAAVLIAGTVMVWKQRITWQSLSDSTIRLTRNVLILSMATAFLGVWTMDALDFSAGSLLDSLTVILALVGLGLLPALSIISQPMMLERLRRR